MNIIGILITIALGSIAFITTGAFISIKIVKALTKISEGTEHRNEINRLNEAHAKELMELKKQINTLSDLVIEDRSRE